MIYPYLIHEGEIWGYIFNTLRPRQNGRRFADDTFIRIFLNENVRISIKVSLKFVPKGQSNNIQALVQIMAWCRSGDKPLSEPMVVSLPTHICVTLPQWVKCDLCFAFVIATLPLYAIWPYDWLVQERPNSSALAMELCLSCINSSILG